MSVENVPNIAATCQSQSSGGEYGGGKSSIAMMALTIFLMSIVKLECLGIMSNVFNRDHYVELTV